MIDIKPITYYLYEIHYNGDVSARFIVRENQKPEDVIKDILKDELQVIDDIELIREYGRI